VPPPILARPPCARFELQTNARALNVAVVGVCVGVRAGLQRLFDSEAAAVAVGRAAGLRAVNATPYLKRAVVQVSSLNCPAILLWLGSSALPRERHFPRRAASATQLRCSELVCQTSASYRLTPHWCDAATVRDGGPGGGVADGDGGGGARSAEPAVGAAERSRGDTRTRRHRPLALAVCVDSGIVHRTPAASTSWLGSRICGGRHHGG
jgi:hypothetical protein